MVTAIHRFGSGHADSADTTQVQPSNWNDGHKFVGGNAGDMLTRDPTDAAYGATWKPSPSNLIYSHAARDTTPGTSSLFYVPMPALTQLDWIRCFIEARVYGATAAPIALDLVGIGPSQTAQVLLTLTGAVAAGDLVSYAGGMFDVSISQSPIDVTQWFARAVGSIVPAGIAGQARGYVFAQAPPAYAPGDWAGGWALQCRQLTGVTAGAELLWRASIYVMRSPETATARPGDITGELNP